MQRRHKQWTWPAELGFRAAGACPSGSVDYKSRGSLAWGPEFGAESDENSARGRLLF